MESILRPIAIVSAMREELAAALGRVSEAQRVCAGGREFLCGQWHGHSVVLALSGIGKVAAATTATLMLERFNAKCLVFTGVAGGLAAQAHVGDVVLATQLLQHDMDASPLFPRHEVPLTGMTRYPTDRNLTAALRSAAPQALQDVVTYLPQSEWLGLNLVKARIHEGLVISGDRFVSQTAESQALQRELPDALAVEMECAAMAQVCHDYGVPLAAVRTISDRADDTAHVDFARFIQSIASRYSVAVLERLLSALPA
jgi:adenosylhomocysteine nucleosidase